MSNITIGHLLTCGPRRPRDLQRDFEDWLASPDGCVVYAEALARARKLLAAGWTHYSADAIVHAIRFDRSVNVGPQADGYRINDHHTSRLARRLMAEHVELEGFFTTKPLRGGA